MGGGTGRAIQLQDARGLVGGVVVHAGTVEGIGGKL